MSGAAIIAAIVFRSGAAESPLAWWIVNRALVPEQVLPLAGLGIACALVGRLAFAASALSFGCGLAAGFALYRPLLDPLWTIPDVASHNFLTGPVALSAAGLALIAGRRLRPIVLPVMAAIVGTAAALAIVVTDPSLNDPTNARTGALIAVWIVAAVALSLRGFRRNWFAIAGPIVGSWLIAIGLLHGGASLIPKRAYDPADRFESQSDGMPLPPP